MCVCAYDLIYNTPNSPAIHSLVQHKNEEMDYLQNHVLKAVSSIQDILHVIASLFECVKKESDGMISNIKDLREETYDITSDLKYDISTLEKEVERLNIEIDNINQYDHGDGLVISGEIIPHSIPTENCKEIVLNLFWHHLNINLGVDEISIAHRIGEKPNDVIDNRKIFIKPSRNELSRRIFQATCEYNPPFYVNYYLIYTRRKIAYIVRQLKMNYPKKIIGYHSYDNETCILYNSRDYTSTVTNSPSLVETENRIIQVTIKTIADLERFMTEYLDITIDSYM